jgi:glycosyltransferase involved in cell wall biosynthesis
VPSDPIVTVCIPTYKHSVYLRTCLLSCACQTVSVKIIVVPVKRDEETMLVLENLWAEIDNLGVSIRIIPSFVADVFRQMQLGLDQVDSEFIFYLGSDDAILPMMAQRMMEVAESSRSPNPIVGMSCLLTDENLNPRESRILQEFDLSTQMHRSCIPDNALVKTEMLRRCGGLYDGHRDWDYLNHYALWLRLLKIPDTKVMLLPEIGWLYRQTGTNRSIKRYDTRKKLREHHKRQREVARFYFPDE